MAAPGTAAALEYINNESKYDELPLILIEGFSRFYSQGFKYFHQRTESSETGLQKIGPHKSGEPQPVGTMNLSQQ